LRAAETVLWRRHQEALHRQVYLAQEKGQADGMFCPSVSCLPRSMVLEVTKAIALSAVTARQKPPGFKPAGLKRRRRSRFIKTGLRRMF